MNDGVRDDPSHHQWNACKEWLIEQIETVAPDTYFLKMPIQDRRYGQRSISTLKEFDDDRRCQQRDEGESETTDWP